MNAKDQNRAVGSVGARQKLSSYTRLVRQTQPPLPSTAPPPPFERETDVAGLDWWFDAHMRAASTLLCLESQASPKVAPALEALGVVRDALYALYCDAGDPRMESLVVPAGVLGSYVQEVYGWLDLAYQAVRASSRGETADVSTVREDRALLATPSVSVQLDAAIQLLQIDDASPVDPLRNLRADVAHAFTACASARAALARE